MNKIEILAPAGSFESVLPAVRMGADAIYLGADKFSARAGAGNFNREELIKTVEYCHIRNVKVYLAVNTLIKDNEIDDVLDLIAYAVSLPVDAIIVQDLGLANIIRSLAPKVSLHASTQMSVHTPGGAEFLYNLGFKRVVLARELSKKEIAEIVKVCPIETEVFVHGALCMSVSGQCYFSAMLGGRSGNRGRCAQTCRLPFSVENSDEKHSLSLKDYSIINYINELADIGVTSAKIEGRMKRPEYVAAAVAACKSVLSEGKCDEKLSNNLKSVFSRSGFTDGYYKGNLGKNMFGFRTKEDVLNSNEKVLSEIRSMYKDEVKKNPVSFKLYIKNGEPAKLSCFDDKGNFASCESEIPQKALNIALTKDICISKLLKTGGTPFFCKNVEVFLDDGLSLPLSKINFMKKQVLNQIEHKRSQLNKKHTFSLRKPEILETHKKIQEVKLRAFFEDDDIPDCFKKCELVYVPINTDERKLNDLIKRGFNLAVHIPRTMFSLEKNIIKRLNLAEKLGIKDVWVGNLGALKIAKETDMFIHGGYGLNIFNSYSASFAKEIGLCDIELSFEMTLDEIKKINVDIKKGIIAYGRQALMLTRNCPNKNSGKKCSDCSKLYYIKDRFDVEFPVICDGNSNKILNSVALNISDKVNKLSNIDFAVLTYSVENSVEKVKSFEAFNNQNMLKKGFTRGIYCKGVE